MYSILLVIFGTCLGLLLAQLDISSTIESVTGEEPDHSGSGPVVLDSDQVELMNKIYTEREDEYGFCFNRGSDVNQSVDLRHPSSIDYSNSTYINWSCPTGFEGMIHTHPGWDAAAELSRMDKETLVNSTYTVSCVMARTIPTGSEVENPDDFQCFNDPLPDRSNYESDEDLEEDIQNAVFERVSVRVKPSKQ